MKESTLKATQFSTILTSELKECYRKSNPLEELVVRQLLRQAVELQKHIQEFATAINPEKS